ncbi:MAG TPA: SMP-30/gluconolactonase/LRE family protein [Candidatus Dormibacteraeota bacterium]|nr:SMP-30/gluconolactonase/LRE family protein [Candidatus Dormibacteraeota bacterium]
MTSGLPIMADGGLKNRRVWAALRPQAGEGICLDAEGAVWCSVVEDGRPACVRVGEGGQVLQRIELDQFCFACMLGGRDGRTLFMMVADWRGVEHLDALVSSRTGRVLTVPAPAPGAGWP